MNAMWLCFHTKLFNLTDKYIPLERFNSKPKPKWLNLFTLKKIKLKHKTWNIYNITRHHEDFISYAKYRNIATTAVTYAKWSFETKLAKDIQQNPILFWKYVTE